MNGFEAIKSRLEAIEWKFKQSEELGKPSIQWILFVLKQELEVSQLIEAEFMRLNEAHINIFEKIKKIRGEQ